MQWNGFIQKSTLLKKFIFECRPKVSDKDESQAIQALVSLENNSHLQAPVDSSFIQKSSKLTAAADRLHIPRMP